MERFELNLYGINSRKMCFEEEARFNRRKSAQKVRTHLLLSK